MSDMATTTGTAIPTWTLGDRLRKAREWAGIKQEEMARRLAKSRTAISGWEGDQHRPDMLAIRAWSHETEVPVWWLLGEEPDDQSVTSRYQLRLPITSMFTIAA